MFTINSRLWVLGAGDPEMAAIEKLLREAGERVAYAIVGGARVHPGNAYRAQTLSEYPMGPLDEVILIECGFEDPDQVLGLVFGAAGGHGKVTVVDHHRPGDPGYGQPAERFLSASSIGQVIALLAKGLKDEVFAGWTPEWAGHGTLPTGEFYRDPCGHWAVQGVHSGYEVPEQAVLTAAADHCLEAAYRGKCPGVDPQELMEWRAKTRATFQKRPVADVLRDVEAARRILREAVLPIPGNTGGCLECNYSPDGCLKCNYSGGEFPEFADLRGQQIPELPEAAAREGIAFLSTVKDKDGREKVVLQAAPAELVQKFLAGEIVKDLADLYGDPARGFAGGYKK